MPIHLEIVTAERVVLSDDVDQINAPTKDGRVGILPRHMPLLTILDVGELTIIKDGATTLGTGTLNASGVDEARAEEARRRAEEQIAQRHSNQDIALAEAELRRALIRLKVAQLKRNRRQ